MQNKMINKVEEIQSYQLNCWSFTAAEKFIFKLQMLIKLLPMKRRINWQIKLGSMLDVFLYYNTQSPKHVIILIFSVSQKPLNCICCTMLQMMTARLSLTSSKEACLFLLRWVTMTMTPIFLFNNVTCMQLKVYHYYFIPIDTWVVSIFFSNHFGDSISFALVYKYMIRITCAPAKSGQTLSRFTQHE